MRLLSTMGVLGLCACAAQDGENALMDEAFEQPAAHHALAATAPPAAASQAMITWAQTPRSEPPTRLTASDGTGLSLVSAKVRAVVQEPLAFTELHLTFENPEKRVREGRFEITLPDGAAISRFAMKIDGEWQEGEVVEKQRARRIYEDFLHRRQDPALLEQDAGNTFRARVFPIPAKGTKDLILSFSQEVADGRWSMPLAGLDTLDLDVDVTVVDAAGGTRTLSEQRRGWKPDADLEVTAGAPGVLGMSAGEYHVVRVQPQVSTEEARIKDLTVLLDTSASRALSLDADLEHVGSLVAALPGKTPVSVGCFDQTVSECWSGRAKDFVDDGIPELTRRRALGASDLQAALRWASDRPRSDRLWIVSDGVPTAGALEAADLEGILAASAFERADVLAPEGARDLDLLQALVRGDLPQDGIVTEIQSGDAKVRLSRATRSGIEVSVPGAAWVWPQTLQGVQPGDERLVYAVMPDGGSPVIHLDGQATTQPSAFRPAQRPLLERAAVGANLARLRALRGRLDDREERERLTQQIVELSTTHRVLTEDTALLVLETEEDYRRYDLARNGLADILEVHDGGLRVRQRNAWVVPPADKNLLMTKTEEKKSKDKGRAKSDSETLTGREDAGAFREPEPSEQAALNEPVETQDRSVDLAAARPAPPVEVVRGQVAEEVDADGSFSNGVISTEDEEAPSTGEFASADEDKADLISPWDGRYAAFRQQLDRGDIAGALAEARAWRAEDPLDVLALIALGEALVANGEVDAAARAYGSIIDLYPSRADLRRMAGERLESLGGSGLELAIDTFTVANGQRPDQITGGRLLAYALVQGGRADQAFDVLEEALKTESRDRQGVEQVLREDLGLVGAAWIAAHPDQRDTIVARAQTAGAIPPSGPSTRFVLSWETDANDVDLHIRDAQGGHAFYSQTALASGGALIADVTNGYGPEAFVIAGEPTAGPYELSAHYYSRGPMGYGMGTLQVVTHDGAGGIAVDARPFVVMTDGSTVGLGSFAAE